MMAFNINQYFILIMNFQDEKIVIIGGDYAHVTYYYTAEERLKSICRFSAVLTMGLSRSFVLKSVANDLGRYSVSGSSVLKLLSIFFCSLLMASCLRQTCIRRLIESVHGCGLLQSTVFFSMTEFPTNSLRLHTQIWANCLSRTSNCKGWILLCSAKGLAWNLIARIHQILNPSASSELGSLRFRLCSVFPLD